MRLLPTVLITATMALAGAGGAFAATPDFSHVQVLSTVAGTHDSPSVGIDAAGNAVAIWSESEPNDTTDSIVQAAYRPAGGLFGAAVRISPTAGVHGAFTDIAMNARGDAVATWFIHVGSNELVLAAFRPAGAASTFGAPATLATIPDPDERQFPNAQAAIDPAGNAVVTWNAGGVQASYRPAGGAFGPTEALAVGGPAQQLVMLPDGTAMVQLDGAIAVQTRTPGAAGTWSRPTIVSSDPATSSATDTRMAVNERGDVVVAYRHERGSGATATEQISAVVRPIATGSFSPEFAIGPSVTAATGYQSQPSPAIDAAGNVIVTWMDGTGPVTSRSRPDHTERIASTTIAAGVFSAGAPVPISTAFGLEAQGANTASSSDAGGTFVAMGVKGDDLEYQLRTLAGTPGPVQRVPLAPIPLVANWPGQLDLAENADGDAVVVYAQGDEQIQAAYPSPAIPRAPRVLTAPGRAPGAASGTTAGLKVVVRYDLRTKLTATGTIRLPGVPLIHLRSARVTALAGALTKVSLPVVAKRDRSRVSHALGRGTVKARITIRAAIGSKVKQSTLVVKLHR